MARPQHSGLAWADAIVSALIDHGVDTFFIGPGSRSTPLVLAVARNRTLTTVIHYDERAAAFAALGFARATQRPAAVVTTSGTAVANLFPAVVEASMDGQPMVVLSADRPLELRGIGANQTIDQVRIFGSYVRYFADVPAPAENTSPASARDFVDQACRAARFETPGPVHLNCMFREPLAPEFIPEDPVPHEVGAGAGPVGGFPDDHHAAELQHAESAGIRTIRGEALRGQPLQVHSEEATADPHGGEVDDLTAGLIDKLVAVQRGIVLVGRLHRLADARAAERVAEVLGWPLLPDIGSQIPRHGGGRVVISYDRILDADFAARHRPDAVLHLGGSIVSKRLGLWLAEAQPKDVIHVTGDALPLDPYRVVTLRLQCTPARFAERVEGGAWRVEGEGRSDEWAGVWQDASDRAGAILADELDTNEGASIDEPSVARIVWNNAPRGCAILIGNSMPVRDFDAYAWGAAGPQFVATNRGASGIDGLVATAFGVALGRRCPVVAVIGDLSLLHDLGSLTMLAHSEQPIVVVVVNNGGGGIFSFLPIAQHTDVFERYFAAAHDLTFGHAASLARIGYSAPRTRAQFREALKAAFETDSSSLIEVNTSRADNKSLHDRISARFKAELGGGS
jgi:2-succinyl-5-enolpyruvyl-6-hydroxy-3-cyclohexene-1-carboxylate synthase